MLTMFYWNYLDAAVLMPSTFYHGWRKKFYTFNLLNCLILLNTCANVHKRCPYLTLQSYKWLKLGLGMSVVHRLDNERVCILIKWLSSQRLAWSDPLQWVLLQNLAQGFLNLILPQNHQLSLLKMEFLGPTSHFQILIWHDWREPPRKLHMWQEPSCFQWKQSRQNVWGKNYLRALAQAPSWVFSHLGAILG